MSNFKKLLIAAGKVGKITATSLWRATGQTMQQNRERMAQTQAHEAEEAAKLKSNPLTAFSKQMDISQARKVLDLPDGETLSIEQILERHAKLIETNESAKLPSAYLIAKINNAKEALELQTNIDQSEKKDETDFVEDLESEAKKAETKEETQK